MRKIIKRSSPIVFEEWKIYKQPLSWRDLGGMPVSETRRTGSTKYYSKHELREKLLAEQENLCCYCECEIKNDPLSVKIDHIQPQSNVNNQNLIFDYSNLGLSCSGGERDPRPRITHCDSSKRNRDIPLTPYSDRCEKEIDFTLNGNIVGKTEDAVKTIDILNLNISKLINLRSSAIFGIIYNDKEGQNLISSEEAYKIHSKLGSKSPTEYISAILRSLEKIMKTGTYNKR